MDVAVASSTGGSPCEHDQRRRRRSPVKERERSQPEYAGPLPSSSPDRREAGESANRRAGTTAGGLAPSPSCRNRSASPDGRSRCSKGPASRCKRSSPQRRQQQGPLCSPSADRHQHGDGCLLPDSSDSGEGTFLYSSETLEKLMNELISGGRHSSPGGLTMIERENIELKRRICCMQAQEQLEAEKLCQERQMLEYRLNRFLEIRKNLQSDLDMYRQWNGELEKMMIMEADQAARMKREAQEVKEAYEQQRMQLYEVTVKLHDEIRFRTLSVPEEEGEGTPGRTLNLGLFQIHLPSGRKRMLSRKPRKIGGGTKRWLLKFSDKMRQYTDTSMPIIAFLLVVFLFWAIGLIRFECKLTTVTKREVGEKVEEDPTMAKGPPPKGGKKGPPPKGTGLEPPKGAEAGAKGKDKTASPPAKGKPPATAPGKTPGKAPSKASKSTAAGGKKAARASRASRSATKKR